MKESNHSLRLAENSVCRYRPISGNGIRVIWEITGRCNLHCKHCFASVSPVLKLNDRELTTMEAFRIIDQFDTIPIAKVMLTGGEVFVRNDIESIIKAIRQKGKDIVIDITTNALLLDDNRINKLKELNVDELSISLDGPKEVYRSVRGANADYDRLIDNIMELISNNIHVDGIMVLNRLTMDTLEETVSIAAQLGLSSLTIANLETLPHSNFDYESLCLSDGQIENSLKKVEILKQAYGDKLVIRSVGFIECAGAGHCSNRTIIAIDRNGMYCHCLNVYLPNDLRIDSRTTTLESAFTQLNQ